MTKPLKAAQFSINPETGSVTATIGDAKVEVSADGKTVTAYSKNGIVQEISAAAPVSKEGAQISLSKDFNTAVVNGVTLRQSADGCLIIAAAPGTVIVSKPVPANDSGKPVPAEKASVPPVASVPPAPITPAPAKPAPAKKTALVIGEQTADGSVYGGLTPDGKKQIFVMPKDLDLALIFNEAAKAVDKLNTDKALGHSDWQIGSMEVMRVLKKHQHEGALKGTFKTDYRTTSWYWTSSEVYDKNAQENVARTLLFAEGVRPDESALLKGMPRNTRGMPPDVLRALLPKQSCRPVRLVPVAP